MKFELGQTGAFEVEFDYGKLNISSNTEIGYRPVHLLVSSIAGCSGGLLKKVLEKKRIAFDTIHIDAEVERESCDENRFALHGVWEKFKFGSSPKIIGSGSEKLQHD